MESQQIVQEVRSYFLVLILLCYQTDVSILDNFFNNVVLMYTLPGPRQICWSLLTRPQRINVSIGVHFIRWIATYPLDRVIRCLNNCIRLFGGEGAGPSLSASPPSPSNYWGLSVFRI